MCIVIRLLMEPDVEYWLLIQLAKARLLWLTAMLVGRE